MKFRSMSVVRVIVGLVIVNFLYLYPLTLSAAVAKETPSSKAKPAFDSADLETDSTRSTPLEVTAVKPSVADSREVHQVTITFNKPMVPLGDFEKLAQGLPVSLSPEIPCHWRWLNRMSLACELDQSLPGSNQYLVKVGKGIKAHDGTALEKEHKVFFSTEKWRVVRRYIEWKEPDLPVIYIAFTQPIRMDSLQSSIESSCGDFKVRAISKKDAERYSLDETRSYEFQFPNNLGLDRNCEFKVPRKTLSQLGKEPGRSYKFNFKTYPEFYISAVHCQHKVSIHAPFEGNARIEGCDPDTGVRIGFSAPVLAGDLAGKIDVQPFFGWTEGGYGSPKYFEQNPEEEMGSVYLNSPMQGRSRHVVTFGELKDKFGRPLLKTNVVEIATIDFRPMLKMPEGYGVLEKKGPHRVGFTAVNVGKFLLKYYPSKKPDEVDLWKGHAQGYQHCRGKADPNYKKKYSLLDKPIETGVELNIPQNLPLDLPTVHPGFDHGMFFGRATEIETMETANALGVSRDCQNFFLVVTDLGIMAKMGFYDSGIWIHSITDGTPMSGVHVSFRDYHKVHAKGVTDENGFAALDGAVQWDPERKIYRSWGGKNSLFVVAETDDDFAALPFREGERGISNYSFSSYTANDYVSGALLVHSRNHIVHAITDRPLYQPGQTVKIKIFGRYWEPRTFGLRPATAVDVVVSDSMGKEIFKETVKLSEFGTAHAEFKLDAGVPLGPFQIQGRIGRWRSRIGSFAVQEFQLPPFKVKVEASAGRYRVGEAAEFHTRASYHFGGGVAQTDGKYHVTYREQRWTPSLPKWRTFQFDNPVSLNIKGYEKPRTLQTVVLESGDQKTDRQGETLKIILLAANQIRSYGKISFESRFKDDRGKNIAGSSTAEVVYSDFQIGVRKKKWAYEATEEIEPEIVVVDQEENPVPGQKVVLKLVHRKYKSVRVRGAGNYFSYQTRTTDQLIDTCEIVSAEEPKGCALQPKAAGSHYILVEAQDANGRWARSSAHAYVTGSEYVGWFRENHDRIDIIPDKPSYDVGDTISLLVKNPYESVDAIFTLERFGILKQFRKKLGAGAELVKIALDSKDYAPGFNLSVHLIKGRVSEKLEGGVDLGKPSFKMGLAKINVVDPDTVLKITSKTDRQEYQPGEEVKVSVRVESPVGIKRTELSVAVVDERILQLAGNYKNKYNLHDKFYNWNLGDVHTSQMLTHLIGRRHFGKKGAPEGGDGDGSAIRKNFLPLAYWNPSLVTDEAGNASFTFKTPDNLTGWRILLVAVDKQHRFGFGGSSFKTSKKLMLEPALPSFLTEGDTLNSRITVFNRTGSDRDITGKLQAEGAELKSAAETKLRVEDNGKGFLEWKLKAPWGGKETRLTVSAKANGDRDAALYKLPIRPYLSYETFATYDSTTKGKVTVPLKIPPGIRTDVGGIDLIVSSSLISHLDEVFHFTLNYPYTCWEQTLVRALMLNNYLLVSDYLADVKPGRDPRQWIQELLAEMPSFQADNGGMAYWKPKVRAVDAYLSTFTALGLIWLERNGNAIPREPSRKLYQYVRDILSGKVPITRYSKRTRATILAMATYVVTLLGDDSLSYINRSYQEKDLLSLFGKSFLWMAAKRVEPAAAVAAALKKEIFAHADMTSGSIQFQEVVDDGFQRILHSTTRTNCNLLTAMVEDDPGSPFVQPLVRWVIGTRKANRWNNTQENLYCLNALSDYAKIFEAEKPDFQVTGTWLDEPIESIAFKDFKDKPMTRRTPFKEALVGKDSAVTLERTGTGRAYFTTRIRFAYKEVRTDRVNSGMQVSRKYYLKNPEGEWVPQSNNVKAKRGDLLRVQLKVKVPATRYQVALADSLPAGFEPLNTALAATSKVEAEGEGHDSAGRYTWNEDDYWWGYYFNGGFYHREMRLYGAQYFADFLEPGEYEINYIAQAVATGEFNVNPVMVEQMYEPEVYGKSTPAKFEVSE